MVLVANDCGEFLMVKRPPSGIWGGLWVLPEIPDHGEDYQRWCQRELAVAVGPGRKLEKISHGFTHFELEMLPVLCALKDDGYGLMDVGEYLWYNPLQREEIAMPAAMKKIFNQIEQVQP